MFTGGDILGTCYENNLFDEHKILLPPYAKGKVIWIAEPGLYTIKENIVELEYEGKKTKYTMSH